MNMQAGNYGLLQKFYLELEQASWQLRPPMDQLCCRPDLFQ
jgi:hypothetical protein